MPPAVYVQPSEFRDRVGDKATASSAMLETVLEMASRAIDRDLSVAPGMFAPIASTALTFSPSGGTTLYLRDTSGYQCFLRTIEADSLKLDTDADGSFDDYLWDLADGWLRGLPENASAFGEPYTAVELNPYHSSAPLAAWPTYKNSIQITGTWGWANVPGAITELVVDMARNVLQAQRVGSVGLPSFEGELPLSPSMWPILQRVRATYSYRMPV